MNQIEDIIIVNDMSRKISRFYGLSGLSGGCGEFV